MTIGAFFDDAGTHSDSDVVSWGGFVGTMDQWATLTDDWYRLLDDPSQGREPKRERLEKFSLSKCEALDGPFKLYNRAEADRIQNDVRQIIRDAGVVGVAYSIDVRAYNRLVTGEAREIMGDAETVCFRACFHGAYENAGYFPAEDYMLLQFDRVSGAGRLEKLQAAAVEMEQAKAGQAPFITNVMFGKVVNNPPLQAADIIATEQCWYSKILLGYRAPDRTAHRNTYFKQVRAAGLLMGEEQIRETLRNYGFSA